MAWSAPSHYLKQCWNIVNWTLRKKLQLNFNRNSDILFQENALQSVVCKMAAILSRPQCVKKTFEHCRLLTFANQYVSPGPEELKIVSEFPGFLVYQFLCFCYAGTKLLELMWYKHRILFCKMKLVILFFDKKELFFCGNWYFASECPEAHISKSTLTECLMLIFYQFHEHLLNIFLCTIL